MNTPVGIPSGWDETAAFAWFYWSGVPHTEILNYLKIECGSSCVICHDEGTPHDWHVVE